MHTKSKVKKYIFKKMTFFTDEIFNYARLFLMDLCLRGLLFKRCINHSAYLK